MPKLANRQMAHRGTSYEACFYSSVLTGVASVAAKGIAATEAAVVCVNSGSPLTVPMNSARDFAADPLAKLLASFYPLQ